jgi:hypothetical protein
MDLAVSPKAMIRVALRVAAKSIIATYFLTTAWIPYLYRALFGTVWGALVLALCAYYFAHALFGVVPLPLPGGLIQWFSDLPVEGRTAVTTAVLTTVGFMAAFWANYAVWQQQTAMVARANAADAVLDQLMNAIHATSGLRFYLSMMRNAVEAALAAPTHPLAAINLKYVVSQTNELLRTRGLLQVSHLALTELPTRHSNVLTNTFGLSQRIQWATAYFQNALKMTFEVELPAANPGAPTFVQDYLNQVNVPAVDNALRACDIANSNGGALLGYVQGQLKYGAYPPTLSGMLNFTRDLPKNIRMFGVLFPGKQKTTKT